MDKLTAYYNKFNEDKRLLTPHGRVEYETTMHFIQRYLEGMCQGEVETGHGASEVSAAAEAPIASEVSAGAEAPSTSPLRCPCDIKILDIGAGTGRYSIPLAMAGYDVTAVEYVRYNLGILKKHVGELGGSICNEMPDVAPDDSSHGELAETPAPRFTISAHQGNALRLSRFADDTFHLTLLFGPMYHLQTETEQLQALMEAKRVTKPGGIILVAYCMNEYAILTYGFVEHHIKESIKNGVLDEDFHCLSGANELYTFMRLEDIDRLNAAAGLTREGIFSPDGPANHMRPILHSLDEEEFALFLRYHLTTCQRPELLGAGAHTVDVLKK